MGEALLKRDRIIQLVNRHPGTDLSDWKELGSSHRNKKKLVPCEAGRRHVEEKTDWDQRA